MEHDPFQEFGPGVVSYFRMIKALIVVFGILSLLVLPIMIVYTNGGALTYLDTF